jgi:hypothetical protein
MARPGPGKGCLVCRQLTPEVNSMAVAYRHTRLSDIPNLVPIEY